MERNIKDRASIAFHSLSEVEGNSDANNLPGPTDVTENPYGKKTFFKDATQKSASMVQL
jgi:hypothetical protein